MSSGSDGESPMRPSELGTAMAPDLLPFEGFRDRVLCHISTVQRTYDQRKRITAAPGGRTTKKPKHFRLAPPPARSAQERRGFSHLLQRPAGAAA